MNISDKITVIIPVYNVLPYLRRCIDSVLAQTYQNLEIVLVDDGSTDGSENVCDEYNSTSGKITVIHQKNSGLACARNTGLEVASGDWIAFLDSDDWVEPEMYEALLSLALVYNADISSCASRNVTIDEQTSDKEHNAPEKLTAFSSDDMIRGLLTEECVRFEVWNKLWKRSLIGDERFVSGQVCEDVHFDRILFRKANKMIYTNEVYHNYLCARPGNTKSSFKQDKLCIFSEFDVLIKELNDEGKDELAEIVRCIAIYFAIMFYKEAFLSKQSTLIKNTLKSRFNKYYPSVKSSRFRNKKAITVFKISPDLYVHLGKLRDCVRKSVLNHYFVEQKKWNEEDEEQYGANS